MASPIRRHTSRLLTRPILLPQTGITSNGSIHELNTTDTSKVLLGICQCFKNFEHYPVVLVEALPHSLYSKNQKKCLLA